MQVQLKLKHGKDVTLEKVDKILHSNVEVFFHLSNKTDKVYKVKSIASYVAKKEQDDINVYADVSGKNGQQKYQSVPCVEFKDEKLTFIVDDYLNQRQWSAIYQVSEVRLVHILVNDLEEIMTHSYEEQWRICQDLISQGYMVIAEHKLSKWLKNDKKWVIVYLELGGK